MASRVVGDKGRLILPVAVRTEAGVDIGDELIIRTVAPGQIMLETREVVIGRLRSRFANSGGTKELRNARQHDNRLDDRRSRPPRSRRSEELEDDIRRAEQILSALEGPASPHSLAS